VIQLGECGGEASDAAIMLCASTITDE